MAVFKCKICGGALEIDDNESVVVCEYCGRPISTTFESESVSNKKNKKGRLKKKRKKLGKKAKRIMLVISLVVILIAITSVIITLLPSKYKWDEVLLKSALPVPVSEYGDLYDNCADDLYLVVTNTSFLEYEDYVKECENKGYTYVLESSASSYKAYNSDGYELELEYSEYNEKMTISLEVRVAGVISWSHSELAALLPVPKSNMGTIVNDNSYFYELYLGNISKDEFNEYVADCESRGFTISCQKQDDYFYAKNESGHELSIEYYGCDLIYLQLETPDD
ncbi:MAG: hypothetical protein IKT55_03975 [Clostridia bacterium]|nr:hypothetical protein [Clostridia bacterium]